MPSYHSQLQEGLLELCPFGEPHFHGKETVGRMVAGSICFSLYSGARQIGFGRSVTDSATFTWVADIVVEPEFRGAGLGQWIMEYLVAYPSIEGTQMVLQTRDAQGLY